MTLILHHLRRYGEISIFLFRIIAAGAGTGISARFIERGGADAKAKSMVEADVIAPRPTRGLRRDESRGDEKKISISYMRPPKTNHFLVSVAASIGLTSAAFADNGTWNTTTSGALWTLGTNWTGSIIADGSGNTANFSLLDITADTTVDLNGDRTLGNLIFGDTDTATGGSWTLNGAGVLTLAGVTPTITVNALGTGKNAAINVGIAGTSGLTKSGSGVLTLPGNITYTGTTTISAGTLALSGGNDRLGTSGNITIGASGTLDLGGNTQTTTGLVTFTSGATLKGGTLTSNHASLAGNNFFTGTINLGADGAFVTNRRLLVANGGTGSLNIGTGSTGSITFGGDASNNMNYVGVGGGNGVLNVNGGTVNFNNSTSGSGNGYLNVGSNSDTSTGSIVVNGGNLNVGTWLKLGGTHNNGNGTNATSSLAITTGTVTLGGGSDATSNGVLFMNGSAGNNTVNTGTSTLTLNSGGVLNVKQIQAGNEGTKTIYFDGGTLRAGAVSTSFLNVATGLTVNVMGGGANFDTQANSITVAAALTNGGGGGGLTVSGSGSAVLTLTGANTFTGATTINSGAGLQIGNGTTNGSIAASSGVSNSGSLTFNLATGSTSVNAITGTGSFTKSGAGTLTLSQANTIGGNATLCAGVLNLNGATTSVGGILSINNGTLENGTINYTGLSAIASNGTANVSADLTGNTSWTKTGAGTLLLTGSASLSGTGASLNVSGGTFQIGDGGTLTVGNRLLAQGGALQIDAGGFASFRGDSANSANYVGVDGGAGTLTMNGGTLNFNTSTNGAGWLRIGANSATGNATINAGLLDIGHSLNLGARFNNDGATAATGSGTLTVAGTGQVIVGSGTNTTTAGGNKGYLYLKNAAAGSSGSATVNLDGGSLTAERIVAGSGGGTKTVNFNGGTLIASASDANFLDAASGFTANVKNDGAKFDTQEFHVTVRADLVANGAGGLTKSGNGILTLSGANTYSGGTTVSEGTLLVNGDNSAATGNVTVASGTTLGGIGKIGGNTSVTGTLSTGTLATVGSVGTLDFGTKGLTFDGTSSWLIDLVQGVTESSDSISVSALIIGAGSNLTFNHTNSYNGDEIYTLASYTSRSGTFANFATSGVYTIGGGDYFLNYGSGTNGAITLTAVPEPGTLSLLGLAFGGYVFRRLRKCRA